MSPSRAPGKAGDRPPTSARRLPPADFRPPTSARRLPPADFRPPTSARGVLALYVAFVARYPWVRMGHGRAAFLLPLGGPFALSRGLGWLVLPAGRSRAVRGLLLGSLAVLVALPVACGALLVT